MIDPIIEFYYSKKLIPYQNPQKTRNIKLASFITPLDDTSHCGPPLVSSVAKPTFTRNLSYPMRIRIIGKQIASQLSKRYDVLEGKWKK
jgi:hypothetical protein